MAERFWVGGTGTWNSTNTANWATSSGGASGASAPTSADNVTFDALSGSGTVTTDATAASANITVNTSTLTVKLGANFTTTTGSLILTLGTFDINSFNLSCLTLSSINTNVRTLAFGTGQLTLTIGNSGAFPLSMSTATNFSYTGTSNIVSNYSGGLLTRSFRFGTTAGATEANVMNLSITAGTDIISPSGGYKNVNLTGFNGTASFGNLNVFGDLIISSGTTVAASGATVGFYSSSAVQKITTNNRLIDVLLVLGFVGSANTLQLQDNLTMGPARTFTMTAGTLDLTGNSGNWTLSTGLFSSTNSNTRAIVFGTGAITTTGTGTVWNTGTVANFSRTGTPTVNISNNSATATTVSTGAMTEAQSLNFNYTTGSYTLTDTAAVYRSVNFTGFTGTIPNSVRTIYGSMTLVAGMTLTAGTNATTFASTAAGNTITSAGKTQDYPITFDGVGGVWTCQDALTLGSTRALTFTNGTLNLKSGATSTVGSFVTTGSNQKYLGSSTPGTQATISDASGVNSVSFLTIQDSVATGGADWEAYASNANIDAGNNLNWDFGATPILGTEYEYKLRSFTQPRRF